MTARPYLRTHDLALARHISVQQGGTDEDKLVMH